MTGFVSWTQWLLFNLGGPTLVLGALFGWLGKRYLDKALQEERARTSFKLEEDRSRYTMALEEDKSRYAAALEVDRSRYASSLERQKSQSEREIHVYKAQFELEFKVYQEIWATMTKLAGAMDVLFLLYSREDFIEDGKSSKRQYAEEADAAFFQALKTAHKYRPFVDPNIHSLAARYAALAKDEIREFFGAIRSESTDDERYSAAKALEEARDGKAELTELYEEIATLVRARLASLVVIGT